MRTKLRQILNARAYALFHGNLNQFNVASKLFIIVLLMEFSMLNRSEFMNRMLVAESVTAKKQIVFIESNIITRTPFNIENITIPRASLQFRQTLLTIKSAFVAPAT